MPSPGHVLRNYYNSTYTGPRKIKEIKLTLPSDVFRAAGNPRDSAFRVHNEMSYYTVRSALVIAHSETDNFKAPGQRLYPAGMLILPD